jgi:hypothetical protein
MTTEPTDPPYPGTRLHAMRIPDEVWYPALEVARARAASGVEGETVTAVTIRALRAYVRRHGDLIVDLDRGE